MSEREERRDCSSKYMFNLVVPVPVLQGVAERKREMRMRERDREREREREREAEKTREIDG